MTSKSGNLMETKEESTENLWNKILSETSKSVTAAKTQPNLVVLGEKSSGKTSLLARLQGFDTNEIGSSMGLDYGTIEIKENDETVERINVWQLEGEKELKELLEFALTAENISNSLVIITLDLAQPWNIAESLTTWLEIIERYTNKILTKLPPGVVDELKNNLIYDLQNYTEPTPGQPSKLHRKKPIEEHIQVPLEDNVLSKNIGVPILVVGCKSDSLEFLEKEYNYKEAHFDFVQQYLRRVCLTYGASLVYVSAKRSINCDVLLDFIRYRISDGELVHKFQITEKDSVFVPVGADSQAKIKITFTNQNLTTDENEPFEEVIKLPKLLQAQIRDTAVEVPVNAEDDQEFLTKHKEELDVEKEKEKLKPKEPKVVAPVGEGSPLPRTPIGQTSVQGTGLSTSIPVIPEREKVAPSPSVPMSPSAQEHQELAAFFDRLINKPGTGRNPATPSTTPQKKPEDLMKQLDHHRKKLGKE